MYITAFRIDYRVYQKYAQYLYIAAVIALILVLIIGVSRGGAKRWFNLGLFTIQPSEIAKIIIIIAISDFISRKQKLLNDMKTVVGAAIIIAIMIIPIGLEPDLGAPILISSVCIAMLFCAGISLKMISMFFLGGLLIVIEECLREPYRFARIKNYFSSLVNIDASSYQLKQSINALGSGGFFGKGIGNSDLKQMYLPEAHTDFIFPIIGEEFGFLGAAVLISAFIYIFIKGVKISKNAHDEFSRNLALGITLLIIFQAIINLAVATGLFPTKGLVLPFISFGGTALITNMALVGILLNISKNKKNR
ncbi:MAG: putative lipid II flippase FtsW, partial [Endomicrobium sp.]|jgi:cell division protein FtsW|nr:putative lipid II flippase FtsW [Endomicrobium sp.]